MASDAMTIRRRLDATKRLVKLHEAGTVAVALATFTLVFFSVEIALDRAFLLDRAFRSAALLAFAVLGSVSLGLGLAFAVRRVSDLFAARTLELRFPALKQSAITYVQMRAGDALGSETALRVIEERLAQDLRAADLGPRVRDRLRRLLRAASVVAAVFVGASALVAGRGFGVCLERVLRPGAGIAPPTRTRIVDLAPRDAHALVGVEVEVATRMEGTVPGAAWVYLAYDEGAWFKVPMRRDGPGWKAALPGARRPYRYFVAAGDTRSDRYAITVLPPPALDRLSAAIEPPGYTGAAPRTVAGGDIEALVGSAVRLRAVPNRPLRSAALVFEDGGRIAFRLQGTKRAVAEFTVRAATRYRIEAEDEHGLRDPAPPSFRIEARVDRAPEVAILQPGSVAEQPPDRPIEIVVEASDDVGVAELRLRTRRRGDAERSRVLPLGAGSRHTFRFDPVELGLGAADSMMMQVEACDRAPTPNVGRSAIHVLHLRRRPEEELVPYAALVKTLNELAPDEEGPPKSDGRLDELTRKQREIIEKILRLGSEEDREFRRLREEVRDLRREVEKRRAGTRELPTRGAEKQESLAALLAGQLERLKERAESLAQRIERRAQEKDVTPGRKEALRQALRNLADAARRLDHAARALGEGRIGESLDSQESAERDLAEAERALAAQEDGGLSEEERRRAEALALLEKALRERTEDLLPSSSPEEAERLKKAARAMRGAQRALEQGSPGSARERAEESLYEMERGLQEDPPRKAPEEVADPLARSLKRMIEEQETVGRETREIDGRRSGGALKKGDADRLAALAKREEGLAAKAEEAVRMLGAESAAVFRWTLDAVRGDLLDLRDLMELKQRSDAGVRVSQEGVVVRLRALLAALEPEPREGGGEGEGGGKPPQVDFEAELKMLRTLQADILRRSEALRSRCKDEEEIGPGDRLLLDKLVQEQDDLRRLVQELRERMSK